METALKRYSGSRAMVEEGGRRRRRRRGGRGEEGKEGSQGGTFLRGGSAVPLGEFLPVSGLKKELAIVSRRARR